MPVPPAEVKARVSELCALIKKNSEDLHKGQWGKIKGYLSNQWARRFNSEGGSQKANADGVVPVDNNQRIGIGAAALHASPYVARAVPLALRAAAVAPHVVKVASAVTSVVASLLGLASIGVDKLIESYTIERAKSLGFPDSVPADLSDEAKKEMLSYQGKYVVLFLAQTVIDAIRKVDEASTAMEDARSKAKDCTYFVNYMAKAEYFYYRVERLKTYSKMLRKWTQGVDEALTKLTTECDTLEKQNFKSAEELVGNTKIHLNYCMNFEWCLFKPEWVKYLYEDKNSNCIVETRRPSQVLRDQQNRDQIARITALGVQGRPRPR